MPVLYIQDPIVVFTVSAVHFAPSGARPPAGTILNEELDVFTVKFIRVSTIPFRSFMDRMTSFRIADETSNNLALRWVIRSFTRELSEKHLQKPSIGSKFAYQCFRKVCQVLFIPVEPHIQVYIPVQKSINAICGDWNPFILVPLYATTPLIHHRYQLLHRSAKVHELTSKERNFFMGSKISNSFRTYSRCSITVNIRNVKVHIRTLYQKQVSQEGISNCIPQYSVGCNYLSLSEILVFGTKVLICR